MVDPNHQACAMSPPLAPSVGGCFGKRSAWGVTSKGATLAWGQQVEEAVEILEATFAERLAGWRSRAAAIVAS